MTAGTSGKPLLLFRYHEKLSKNQHSYKWDQPHDARLIVTVDTRKSTTDKRITDDANANNGYKQFLRTDKV